MPGSGHRHQPPGFSAKAARWRSRFSTHWGLEHDWAKLKTRPAPTAKRTRSGGMGRTRGSRSEDSENPRTVVSLGVGNACRKCSANTRRPRPLIALWTQAQIAHRRGVKNFARSRTAHRNAGDADLPEGEP